MKYKMGLRSVVAALLLVAGTAQAQQVTVSVKNLTHGIYFTPLLISAHDSSVHMFRSGEAASTALQTMAEGGDISALAAQLSSAGAQNVENPAGGLLAPGAQTTATTLDTSTSNNKYLSIGAMLLPTNDGFVGLDSWRIPSAAGTYTISLNAYDAGTEANTEQLNSNGGAVGVAGIPAAPGGHAGSGGTGVTFEEINTKVHIHRGTLGDSNATGGSSDLDNRVHRWLNPVARITVTVQ